MAAVLQHQIIGKVNDLNQKLISHARIIFQLSMECDKLKSENDELKKILKGHKIAILQLRDQNEESNLSNSNNSNITSSTDKEQLEMDITKNEESSDADIVLKQEYNNYDLQETLGLNSN